MGENSMSQSMMSHTLGLAKLRYEPTTLRDGVSSCDCGDKVARMLREVPLPALYVMADNIKQVPSGFYEKKYTHLITFSGTPNIGAIRMNLGNIIRNYLNSED
jgi:hypothetical protein